MGIHANASIGCHRIIPFPEAVVKKIIAKSGWAARIVAVGFLFLASCSPRQAPAAGGAAAPAVSVAEQNVQSPAITQGVVTFVDGTVSVKTGADWKSVTIGDIVPTAASVRTAVSSSCDIQFGKASAIRIGPSSTIELRAVSLTTERKIVDLGLVAGEVACKVNKLEARDRFSVATNAAVCAVRGTRFAVSEREGQAVKVAVQEGAVAILPPSFDYGKLDALAGTANESAAVEAVVDSIVLAAPVVAKDQELSIATADLAEADGIVARVRGELASTLAPGTAPRAPDVSVALPASIALSIKDYAAAAPATERNARSLGADSKRLLEGAATLEVKESLPESPKETLSAPPPPASVPATAASAPYVTVKVSNAGLVSGLAAADRTLFAADSKGALFAFGADGAVVWSAKTGNSENDNSCPVLGRGFLAFAGDKALTVLDASSGKQRFSLPLDSSDSGLFGRRPAVMGDRLYLATSNGIKVYDAGSGASVGTIALPDDVEMTPAVVGTTLYAASVGGVFYIMDGEKLSVSGQIKTSAVQPYAAAPLVSGGSAYFVDRRGLAVRVDLGSRTVVWSRRLDAGKNLGVLQDIVLGEAGLYVFAKAAIYGLSSKDGERLFDPIGGASSPPAIEGGALWFGTLDKRIVALDPASGKTRAALQVAERVVGFPVEAGEFLAFPTESGNVVFVNQAAALH
jgi:outer membrane protein assembly factor BamB